MKIKYFIFGLLVTVFSVINFSSANSFDYSWNCAGSNNCYINGERFITFDSCVDLGDVEFYTTNGCRINFQYSTTLGSTSFDGGGYKYNGDIENLSHYGKICGLSFVASQCSSFPSTLGIKSYIPPLLPGGSDALSGAISNLGNSVSEFIPYLVYISLGILGSLLGFVAIKWLINWIRSKILSPFK